jgi:hypothetical protein
VLVIAVIPVTRVNFAYSMSPPSPISPGSEARPRFVRRRQLALFVLHMTKLEQSEGAGATQR